MHKYNIIFSRLTIFSTNGVSAIRSIVWSYVKNEFLKIIHIHNTIRLSEGEEEEREKVKDGVHPRTGDGVHPTKIMMMVMMMVMMMTLMMMTLMMIWTKINDPTYPGWLWGLLPRESKCSWTIAICQVTPLTYYSTQVVIDTIRLSDTCTIHQTKCLLLIAFVLFFLRNSNKLIDKITKPH